MVKRKEISTKSSSPGQLVSSKKKLNLNGKNKIGTLKFKPKKELYSEFRNVYNFKTMQKMNNGKVEDELNSPNKT